MTSSGNDRGGKDLCRLSDKAKTRSQHHIGDKVKRIVTSNTKNGLMDQSASPSPSSSSSTENESSDGTDSEPNLVDNNSTSGNEDSDTGSINQNLSSKHLLIQKRAKEMSENDSTSSNEDSDTGGYGSINQNFSNKQLLIKKQANKMSDNDSPSGNEDSNTGGGYNRKKITTSTLSKKHNSSNATAVRNKRAQEQNKAISDNTQANQKIREIYSSNTGITANEQFSKNSRR